MQGFLLQIGEKSIENWDGHNKIGQCLLQIWGGTENWGKLLQIRAQHMSVGVLN